MPKITYNILINIASYTNSCIVLHDIIYYYDYRKISATAISSMPQPVKTPTSGNLPTAVISQIWRTTTRQR